MCGRYSIYDIEGFEKRFHLRIRPTYNAAPTMSLPVVLNENNEVVYAKWGISPYGKLLVNVRAETIAEKPMFRKSFENRRCLVPADGFYEWKTSMNGKIPYRIEMKDKRIFCMAGIWNGEDEKSFSIITTRPNSDVEKIHDRMPVILFQSDEKLWLEKGGLEFLKPFSERLEVYQISDKINSPRAQGAELIRRVRTLDSFK